MRKITLIFSCLVLLVACKKTEKLESENLIQQELTIKEAKKILELPLSCITQEFPNRLGQTLGSETDLKTPIELRPVFYGCFDWHSSVHGYWSIVKIIKTFPELDGNKEIRTLLNTLITKENVATELSFFDDPNNRNFERTYGWAWFFKLHSELLSWEDEDAQRWASLLQPMTDLFIERYEEYLPKLNYPIRTGTHDNSAFSMSLTLDYARAIDNKTLEDLIVTHSKRLFESDVQCNLAFEPSGHDFLSPCLEEAYLMSKVLEVVDYKPWLKAFLPVIFESDFTMEVGLVSDRSDGHLVHLDGLNFSRAKCFKGIARKLPELKGLHTLAEEHFQAAFKNITDDDYMGSHWLGSFALYSLE